MKKKAFTLVELLVVVSIIALLIAMLVPSLKAARDVVRATYCRSTINALNKSVFVYAENNRGYMMVYIHTIDVGYIRAAPAPYQTYVCFNQKDGIDPNTGLFKDARGFGLVYAQRLLSPAEMFYCPDQNPIDQRQNIDYYPKPWGTKLGAGTSGYIRNSYMWNPWVMRNPETGNSVTYEDKLMLSRHDNNRFLTSDLLDDWASMRHMTNVSARWNMGFADGHVNTYESGRTPKTSLYNFFMNGVAFHNAGNDGAADQSYDCSQTWLDNNPSYNESVRPKLPQ